MIEERLEELKEQLTDEEKDNLSKLGYPEGKEEEWDKKPSVLDQEEARPDTVRETPLQMKRFNIIKDKELYEYNKFYRKAHSSDSTIMRYKEERLVIDSSCVLILVYYAEKLYRKLK